MVKFAVMMDDLSHDRRKNQLALKLVLGDGDFGIITRNYKYA